MTRAFSRYRPFLRIPDASNKGRIAIASLRAARAFTLLELLVVITIIVILMAILIPTISHIRNSSHQAATGTRVQALMGAIDNYFHTFNAYPGPITDSGLWSVNNPSVNYVTVPDVSQNNTLVNITSTENLTLGLSGGLYQKFVYGTGTLVYDPSKVDQGVFSLSSSNPVAKKYGPFIEAKVAGLEQKTPSGVWVSWKDPSHPINGIPNQTYFSDGPIPEYTDAYPDPLPILYVRATLGANGSIPGATDINGNNAVTAQNSAYDPGQLTAYLFPASPSSVATVYISNNAFSGTPDSQVAADFGTAPYTPANYFGQYTAPNLPRHTGYLLITAGPDRKYMTRDDTINNGSAVK